VDPDADPPAPFRLPPAPVPFWLVDADPYVPAPRVVDDDILLDCVDVVSCPFVVVDSPVVVVTEDLLEVDIVETTELVVPTGDVVTAACDDEEVGDTSIVDAVLEAGEAGVEAPRDAVEVAVEAPGDAVEVAVEPAVDAVEMAIKAPVDAVEAVVEAAVDTED